MIRTLLIASTSLALVTAGCGATTPKSTIKAKDVISRSETIGSIQKALSEAEGGYGAKLVLLNARSGELQSLAAPLITGESQLPTEVKALDLTTALSASALLSDLPNPTAETTTAIKNGQVAGELLMAMCASGAIADCTHAQTLIETNPSRQAAAHALGLSNKPSLTGEEVKAAYKAFGNTLPEDSTDANDERASLITGESCTLQKANKLIEPKLDASSISDVEDVYYTVMADALPLTGIPLCEDGADTCDDAKVCADEPASLTCKKRKTSVLTFACGPVENDLAEKLASLSGGAN